MKFLMENFFKEREKKKVDIIELLKNNFLFNKFTFNELKKIIVFLHERKYSKNEYIFRENQPGMGMYIILEGKVEILKNLPDKKVSITILERNDFFGELALFDDIPRTAAAQAIEDSIIYGFFKPDLLDIMKNYPTIGTKLLYNLATILSIRLKKANEKIDELEGLS